MKNKLLLIISVFTAGLFFSCQRSLNTKLLHLVNDAVFEVILEKPADDQIVYEKEINWDLVPFYIRTDKYNSIGTAFAISKTELITAFHVLELLEGNYDKYFIRDSRGNVYEVDMITGGSKEKDYIIFTVKGKTFSKYFRFKRNFNIGDTVFSIGNALGEGIVIRDGLVLGTIPDEYSGTWNQLKSSATISPGNSGGPLVTPGGKVIALITSHIDNVFYSTPADAILSDDRSVLLYRKKTGYAHFVLANELYDFFETQASLPDTYINVKKLFREAYNKYYDDSLSALFEEAPEYLGEENNEYLLNGYSRQGKQEVTSLSSGDLQVSCVDYNDDKWKLFDPIKYTYNLGDDGKLYYGDWIFDFYKINKPKSASLEKICTDPKYIMDLILKNRRIEREIWWGYKYRILSYGEPASTELFRDSLGRTWITANWKIGFSDEVLIMYILPMPDGPVILTTKQYSGSFYEYDWDLRKLCDHTFPVYGASFDEWDNFFALTQYIPDFLKDMSFKWNSKEQAFSFSCGYISINADKQVFDWNSKSELLLYPLWFKQDDKLEFDVLKVTLYADQRRKENIILYRNIKPDPKLDASLIKNWNSLKLGKFPFNGNPVISNKDNTGFIGSVIKTKQPNPDVFFSLYLEMEEPQSEEDISRRFNAFRKGVSIEK